MSKKRTTAVILSVVAATLALAAVSCNGKSPTAVDAASVDAKVHSTSEAAANGPAHIVNGKGTVWAGDPWNNWLNISFHAKLDADGTAKGNWHHQFRTRVPGGRIVAQVTCLSVVGNEAWMAGYSTQAGNPNNVGKWFGLHVIDNGEGAGVVDEMSRTLWFGPDEQRAIDLCEQMPTDHLITPIIAGNVQVR
jgi:hypothetical protein